MIRIYRAPLKNSVRQWRAAGHPASGEAVLRPEVIAGPYILLADAAAPARRSETFC